jgi:hypothetical protein
MHGRNQLIAPYIVSDVPDTLKFDRDALLRKVAEEYSNLFVVSLLYSVYYSIVQLSPATYFFARCRL